MNRWTRDGFYLQPLWQLLEATADWSLDDESLREPGTACAAARRAYLLEVGSLRKRGSVLATYESRFLPIPAGTIDPFSYNGPHDPDELRRAGVTGPIVIESGWHLSDFPVTNEELEAWCPTHRRWRDEISYKDDEPAVWVNWFIGVEFARWLTGRREDGRYELPDEWLWEYACRWGTTTAYWWGDKMRDDLCCYIQTSDGQTRARADAVATYQVTEDWHPSRSYARSQKVSESPGLLDMHGTVWEWTASRWDASETDKLGDVVLRGGSWLNPAGFCLSSLRDVFHPLSHFSSGGFRLCWRSMPYSSDKSPHPDLCIPRLAICLLSLPDSPDIWGGNTLSRKTFRNNSSQFLSIATLIFPER